MSRFFSSYVRPFAVFGLSFMLIAWGTMNIARYNTFVAALQHSEKLSRNTLDDVLAETDSIEELLITFNYETVFEQPVGFLQDITAPNVLYSLTEGEGLSISGDVQKPTITNTGVLSINGLGGKVTLAAGENVTLTEENGVLTIKSTDTNTDTKLSESEVEAFVFDGENTGSFTDLEIDDILLSATGTSSTTSGSSLVGVYQGNLSNISGTNVQQIIDNIDSTLSSLSTSSHAAVTFAGSLDYLTLTGQEITLNQIDLTTDVTGNLPVVNGGTGSSTALGARNNLGLGTSDTVSFGRLGVGTTNPPYPLSIVASNPNSVTMSMQNTSNAGFTSIRYLNDAGTLSASFGYGNTGASKFKDIAYIQTYSTTTPIALATNSTDRIFITGTGDVGIGTTNPGATLDVQGAAQFGSGNVDLINSTGKIAAINTTYFASVDGSALTNLDATELSSGTVPSARVTGSYTGITGVGTVTAGTWQGSLIGDSYISSSSNWNSAYNTRIATFTTTGSSGAATFASNTLNIPNYTLAGLGGEPAISAGTTSQYWRGDKSWQTLNSTAVGLGNVTNAAQLIASTSSTQSGYFGDIFLYDDSTPSNYLAITNSANLTAARSLSLNVNNADRTVSLSGNLTVSSDVTISGTNTGDQTIILSGDVSGSGTGAITTTIGAGKVTNAMLEGSIANAKLANSSITIGSTAISLGGTSTTLSGLTSLSVQGAITASAAGGPYIQLTSNLGYGEIKFHQGQTISSYISSGYYLTTIFGASANAKLGLYGSSGGSNNIMISHDNTNGTISTGVGNIVLSPASNVGIGTTNPSAKLQVVGNIVGSTLSDGTLSITSGNITGAGNITAGGTITGNGSGLTTLNASNLSTGTVASARISGSYTGITGVGTISTGTWQGTDISATYLDTTLIQSTEIDTSAEIAAIVTNETGSGALVFGTSPSLTTPNIGAASGTSLSLTGNGSGARFLAGTGGASAPGLSFSGDTDTGIFNNTTLGANYLGFSVGGTQRMSITAATSGGIVNIGEDTYPEWNTQGLYVSGDSGSDAGNNYMLRVKMANSISDTGPFTQEAVYAEITNSGADYSSDVRAVYGKATNSQTTTSRIQESYGLYGEAVGNLNGSSSYAYGVYCTASGADYNYCGGNQTWTNTSDRRVKTDITTIEGALDIVNSIRGVRFRRTDDGSSKMQIGFIAQEVLPYVPEAVHYHEGNDLYSMGYAEMTAVIVNAIKEQNEIVLTNKSNLQEADIRLNETGEVLAIVNTYTQRLLADQNNILNQINLEKSIQDVNMATQAATLETVKDRIKAVEKMTNNTEAVVAGLQDRISQLESIFAMQTATDVAALDAGTSEVLGVSDQLDLTSLTVTGDTNINNLGVTGNITAGLLSIKGFDDEISTPSAIISTISGPLKIQDQAAGNLEIMGGKVLIDTDGNIIVRGSMTVDKLNIDEKNEDSKSTGEGIITSGNNEVIVKTTAVTNTSRIFVTGKSVVKSPLTVTDKIAGESFTVHIAIPEEKDIQFDWLIVN